MKKVLLILCVCFVIGCQKDSFDYRNKFIGNYNFSVDYSYWNPLNGNHDSTYSCNGTIIKDPDNNSISIFFSPNQTIQTTIYEDGTISGCNCQPDVYFQGEFETTKTIKFYYMYNGLGSQFNYNVTGDKK